MQKKHREMGEDMVRDDRNPVKMLLGYLAMAAAVYALMILAETFLFPSLFSFVASVFPNHTSLATAVIIWLISSHVAWTLSNFLFLPSWIKDLNKVCGAVEDDKKKRSPEGALVALLGFFTLQIYFIVWAGVQGGRIYHAGPKYGLLMERKTWFYVVMAILLPPLAIYFLIFDYNFVCKSHNSMVIRGIVPGVQGVGTDPWRYVQEYGEDEDDTGDGPKSIGSPNFGKIRFIVGQYAGHEMLIQHNEIIYLGRDSNRCQVVFSRPDISGLHCKIQFIGYPKFAYVVTDYSTNGTYLNRSMKLTKGKEEECPVGSKITLAFGSEEFMLN